MFCTKCGKPIEDNAVFCGHCGAQVTRRIDRQSPGVRGEQYASVPPAPETASPSYSRETSPLPPQYAGQPAETAHVPSVRAKVCGIIGFVLGLWSIVFCWMGVFPLVGLWLGLLGILPGIAGLILCGISAKAGGFRLTKAGKICSIIGLALSGVCWVIGLIITISGQYVMYY